MIALDIASKIVATSLLGDRVVPLVSGTFLGVVYNDAFARGAMLGPLTVPATLLLAAAMLYLIARVCAPLSVVDAAAPRALGLVAGAAAANALDLVRTGRGVVDFLGLPTAEGAIIFNLADVAAYAGVVLLARTAWRVARAALQERMIAERMIAERAPRYPRLRAAAELAWAQRQAPRRNLELVRPVPIFVEGPPAAVPDDDVVSVPPRSPGPSAPDRGPPAIDEGDLRSSRRMSTAGPTADHPTRPSLTLVANRPPR
ncbi:MAG: signal peptidase II [Gemmatimonadaceae bacterium]